MTEARKGRWQTGQSGNPNGRPKGSSEVSKLRAAIAEQLPEILAELIERAKAGDIAAARLLLERVLPALKPVEASVEIPLPPGDKLTAHAQTILHAVATGQVAPAQATQLLNGLAAIARLRETDDFEQRLKALEEKR